MVVTSSNGCTTGIQRVFGPCQGRFVLDNTTQKQQQQRGGGQGGGDKAGKTLGFVVKDKVMQKPAKGGDRTKERDTSCETSPAMLRRNLSAASHLEFSHVQQLRLLPEQDDDERASLCSSPECSTPTCILDDEEFESSSGTATESIRSMSLSDSDDFLSQLGESPYEVVLEEEQETVLLNRARQTVDFVDKQKRKMMTSSSKCSESSAQSRTVWESLALLKKIALPSGVSVFDHSVAVAEQCRKEFPGLKWLHLVAFIHNLGLANVTKEFGAHPLWTVVGESFPVGCKFSEDISYSQYFCSNPDRRKKLFNHPLGVYKEGCGLDRLRMSWGASEYLYTVLESAKSSSGTLPKEAMFLVRYQKFFSLLNPGQHYHNFMSLEDERCLEMLIEFQAIVDEIRSRGKQVEDESFDVEYYHRLVDDFVPDLRLPLF